MNAFVERIELVGGRYDGLRLVIKDPLPYYKVSQGMKDGEVFDVEEVFFKRTSKKHGRYRVYERVEHV